MILRATKEAEKSVTSKLKSVLTEEKLYSEKGIYPHSTLSSKLKSILTKEKLFSEKDKCIYCKRANVRGGFNFAMFAVEDFSAKLKPPQSFYKFDNI